MPSVELGFYFSGPRSDAEEKLGHHSKVDRFIWSDWKNRDTEGTYLEVGFRSVALYDGAPKQDYLRDSRKCYRLLTDIAEAVEPDYAGISIANIMGSPAVILSDGLVSDIYIHRRLVEVEPGFLKWATSARIFFREFEKGYYLSGGWVSSLNEAGTIRGFDSKEFNHYILRLFKSFYCN